MLRLQAFQFELVPNRRQIGLMRQFAGARRFVFNKALALEKERYQRREKRLGYAGLCRLLTEWRHASETRWLADMPVHPLQQSLKDRKRQAEFICVVCGYRAHADLVAALNILAAGHAVIACGESVLEGRSEKQEPTEAAQAAVGISAL